MARGGIRPTIGIEEEYLLVDPETGALVPNRDPAFFKACQDALGDKVTPELFQAQIEIATGVCTTVGQARRELRQLRSTLGRLATKHGMALIACSTHPFSTWEDQHATRAARYRAIERDYRAIARRALVCGMHVHAGVEDEDQRIEIMRRTVPYLPVVLALSGSSPFWRGGETGLKSFRPTIFGEFPRTGLPERFTSWADWKAYVRLLAETGMCTDPSKIWWDIRPSAHQPTVEMRIAEMCTRLEDTLTIAAFYQALVAKLMQEPERELDWHRYQRMLVDENKWHAQLDGVGATFADYDGRGSNAAADLVAKLVDELMPEAERLGSAQELARANDIVRHGTSADRQIECYHRTLKDGGSPEDAHRAVVRWLAATTLDLDAVPAPA